MKRALYQFLRSNSKKNSLYLVYIDHLFHLQNLEHCQVPEGSDSLAER